MCVCVCMCVCCACCVCVYVCLCVCVWVCVFCLWVCLFAASVDLRSYVQLPFSSAFLTQQRPVSCLGCETGPGAGAAGPLQRIHRRLIYSEHLSTHAQKADSNSPSLHVPASSRVSPPLLLRLRNRPWRWRRWSWSVVSSTLTGTRSTSSTRYSLAKSRPGFSSCSI